MTFAKTKPDKLYKYTDEEGDNFYYCFKKEIKTITYKNIPEQDGSSTHGIFFYFVQSGRRAILTNYDIGKNDWNSRSKIRIWPKFEESDDFHGMLKTLFESENIYYPDIK